MPRLDADECRRRVATAPVARLATLRPDGTPRLVPITFALVEAVVYSAVDDVKPKQGPRLARLADVERDPRAALLVDRYADDWTTLWWVRLDGPAEVRAGSDPSVAAGVAALRTKYPQYASAALDGPVLVVRPAAWAGWTASS